HVPSLVADSRSGDADSDEAGATIHEREPEAHVPTEEELDAVEAALAEEIECPACGTHVRISEALEHEHFRTSARTGAKR
ncbi:MAG: hypothetical protein ACLGHT_03330, partial [Acidimicrobiia bacterium]